MSTGAYALKMVYDGWDGYQLSIVRAIAPLSPEQLAYRPAPHLRSVGEIARHIGDGRINWFHRMPAPGSAERVRQITAWEQDPHGNRYVAEHAIGTTSSELVQWLEATWEMIEQTLTSWTVAELAQTYRHTWRGQTYAISRQWTIWRIMAHDIHHGGQLAIVLGMQGIEIPELGDLGGHLTATPLAEW